jgi:hypothetical protein
MASCPAGSRSLIPTSKALTFVSSVVAIKIAEVT